MNHDTQQDGIVYTETTIYSPPEQYAADAPYQIAIIDVESSPHQKLNRITVRILPTPSAERARIGDRVTFVEQRNGVPYFRKVSSSPPPE